jgi:hypothetical protein
MAQSACVHYDAERVSVVCDIETTPRQKKHVSGRTGAGRARHLRDRFSRESLFVITGPASCVGHGHTAQRRVIEIRGTRHHPNGMSLLSLTMAAATWPAATLGRINTNTIHSKNLSHFQTNAVRVSSAAWWRRGGTRKKKRRGDAVTRSAGRGAGRFDNGDGGEEIWDPDEQRRVNENKSW